MAKDSGPPTAGDEEAGDGRQHDAVGATERDVFLLSTRVTAVLREVSELAAGMGIAGVNARTAAIRAGHDALGFAPITDFIDGLTKDLVARVARINGLAVAMTRVAVEGHHAEATCRDVRRALERLGDVENRASLERALGRAVAREDEARARMHQDIAQILGLIDGIHEDLRAGRFITGVSKIGASHTRQNRATLEGVASAVARAVEGIDERLRRCDEMLRSALARAR